MQMCRILCFICLGRGKLICLPLDYLQKLENILTQHATRMLFGDAKETCDAIQQALKIKHQAAMHV